MGAVIFTSLVVFIGSTLAFIAILETRCPQCKKFFALKTVTVNYGWHDGSQCRKCKSRFNSKMEPCDFYGNLLPETTARPPTVRGTPVPEETPKQKQKAEAARKRGRRKKRGY
jgi:hypothetical protein